MPLRVETIADIEAFGAVRADWDRLREENANDLPFYLFDWLVIWWKHFRNDRANVRDSLHVKVVRDGDKVVAIAPLMLTDRRTLGVLSTRVYQLLGTDKKLTEIKGPLASPDAGEAAAQAIVQDLRKNRSWEWVRWTGLSPDSPFTRGLEATTPFAWRLVEPDYVLALPGSWDDLKKGLKRNIRESLRKCYNSLKRDGHQMTFEVAQTPEEMAVALPEFVRLHGLRAKTPDTVVHLDRFSAKTPHDFLEELMTTLAKKNVAKVFTLKIAGKAVASRIGFVVGKTVYLYYSGYDPEWGKYSVMTTTVAEALRWSIENGLTAANLSIGNDVSKTRWGPAEIPYVTAIQLEGGVRSRATYASSTLAYKAKKDPKLQELANRAPAVKKVIGVVLGRRG